MHRLLKKILERRDNYLSLLETATIIVEEENIEISELANIIKNDPTFLSVLKLECENRGQLKGNKKSNTINLDNFFK